MSLSAVNGNKIIAGICSLGQPKDAFIDAFVQLSQSQLLYSFCKMTGALLPFVRNNIILNVYIQDPDFTHILFIDDDMHNFNDESLQKLIDADKDIISAFMLKRKPPYMVVHSFMGQSNEQVQDHYEAAQPVKVDRIGTGFTLIKRQVLDAIREETDRGPIWFTTDREPRPGFEHEANSFVQSIIEKIEHTEGEVDLKQLFYQAICLGRTAHINSGLIGEDIAFCERSKLLGFDVWVHCGVPVGHIGLMSYDPRNVLEDGGEKLKAIAVAG